MSTNYLLSSIYKIKNIIEDVIWKEIQRASVPKDPVIYFLEKILYTNNSDFQRIYYHALVAKNTTKILDAISNYSLKEDTQYIYPATFNVVDYFIGQPISQTPVYVPSYILNIIAGQIYTRASAFDFAHHFVLYIINMMIINRYRIEIDELITKADEILVFINLNEYQNMYKITIASYYEEDIIFTLTL